MSAAILATARAEAASLQRVANWGASGVPATASMYIYVPDRPATKPPILVLSHYCGGTASNVFGQAQTGGIVRAADMYGFIIVVPQTSNNCWDVGSTKALTHDGGGDTHAVAQMVKYAITTYQANADRVYATGDSSGAMMTEALLAVYPEVFKGGSEFAGVPAGCWAAGNPDGSWSSQCAGGQVTHTAQEWGNLARAMYPGYSGHRPRVQLFHGDADSTINYRNHTEAIKQWTNVLGLSTDPTTTETVTLGSHQATRQRWQNSCGYVVLDAFTSRGGDHGPSDAIFNASFVVPFLALDKTDATDPEIAQCGMGGMGGMGGASGAAGTTGTGGAAGMGGRAAGGAGFAGSGGASGGTTGAGGASSSAGMTSGGNGATGGSASVGGTTGAGGAAGLGGNAGAEPATGGIAGNGMGGATPTAGSTSAGGNATGGSIAPDDERQPTAPEASACSCSVVGVEHSRARGFSAALLALFALARRRTRVRPGR
jgi:poly(hydroxyalkanoate) depolymerase family esterase